MKIISEPELDMEAGCQVAPLHCIDSPGAGAVELTSLKSFSSAGIDDALSGAAVPIFGVLWLIIYAILMTVVCRYLLSVSPGAGMLALDLAMIFKPHLTVDATTIAPGILQGFVMALIRLTGPRLTPASVCHCTST